MREIRSSSGEGESERACRHSPQPETVSSSHVGCAVRDASRWPSSARRFLNVLPTSLLTIVDTDGKNGIADRL